MVEGSRTFYRSFRLRVFVAMLLALSLLPPGLLQAEAISEQPESIEEIIVTGSRIVRRDFSAPSPITTIDAAEIDISGTTNIEDLVNTLPQAVGADNRSSNNPGEGIATINLRGLGINRTLVMVNGRRMAPSTVSGAIDVNVVPAALIKRVELVTGGASTVYGSDAMAGVVNFILRNDFEGIEVNTHFDITGQGDGETYDVNLTLGKNLADGSGNATVFFNYHDRSDVRYDARGFSAVTLRENTSTGEIMPSGSSVNPGGVIPFPPTIINGTTVPTVTFNQDGTIRPFVEPDDRFNFAPDNYLQVPLERYVGGAFLNYDFSSNISAVMEALFVRNDSASQFAPAPAFGFFSVNLDNPFLPAGTQTVFANSFDPDGDGIGDIFLFRRMVELEPRQVVNRRDSYRFVAGLKGETAVPFDWSLYYGYSKTDADNQDMNGVSFGRLQQALLVDPLTRQCIDPSGACVPANIFGAGNLSAEAADFIRTDGIENNSRITEQTFQATITGEAYELPAGPVGFAGGLEWRQTKTRFVPDKALFTEDLLGFTPLQPIAGKIEVVEAYAEVLIPLISGAPFADAVSLEAGGRVSDYNHSGTNWTWKVGGVWQPLPEIQFRVMLQQAIRAPNAQELFQSPQQTFVGLSNFTTIDFCLARNDPIGQGFEDICIAQGMDPAAIGVFDGSAFPTLTLTGGNLDLKPETGQTFTVGAVVQPSAFPGLSISLDYYNFEIERAIQNIGIETLPVCFLVGDPNSAFCQAFERAPGGEIVQANFVPLNISTLKVSGLDLQIQHTITLPHWSIFGGDAGIDISVLATWVFENGGQASPVAPFQDCAGFFGFSCAISSFGTLPDFKATTRLTYHAGPLSTSLRWRVIGGMASSVPIFNELFGFPAPTLAVPSVGAEHYLDLSFTYAVGAHLNISAGVNNLLDTDPPYLGGTGSVQANTDPSTYDALGRSFFLRLNIPFGWDDFR